MPKSEGNSSYLCGKIESTRKADHIPNTRGPVLYANYLL